MVVISMPFISPAQEKDLHYFLEMAKQNSPLLNDYRNQILSLQLDSMILRASLRTRVDFISNNSYAPIIAGYGYDEAITNIAQVSALVQASKNIVSRNNRATQYRTFSLQSRSLYDTIALSEQDLLRTVTEQYITTYGDQLAVTFDGEIYDLLKKEDVILKKLTQASIYKQTDYLNFYVTFQQQQLTLLQSLMQYTTDYLTLNYMAGIVDTVVEKIARPSINDTAQFDFYHSVFFRRYITDSLRLENEKRLIDYEYKPKIGTFVNTGYNSTMTFQPYKNFGVSGGVNITLPIYDNHQKQLRYNQINLLEQSRRVNRDFYVNQYNQQIRQLNMQLHATDDLVPRIQEQVRYVRTLIEANEIQLQTGDVKITDHVMAINNYLAARNLLNQNLISRLKIVNQINYWNR